MKSILREIKEGIVYGLLAATCKDNAAVKLSDSLYDWLWREAHDVIDSDMKVKIFFRHYVMALKAQALVDSERAGA